MKRFEFDANDYKEAYNYIMNRTIQMMKYGVYLETSTEFNGGLDVTFGYNKGEYHAIYLYKDFRGKGVYENYVKERKYKILTHVDCGLQNYLRNHNIPFLCVGSFESTPEYKWIQEFYGDKKSERSGVYLMNHVDEGLKVLEDIGASDAAKRAYCIHPIFQGNDDLKNVNSLKNEMMHCIRDISPQVLINVMEYRSVANEYLSKREIKSIDEIRLSPLKDVNDMLIADKVQNYKDFEVHHKSHPRTKELEQYFKNWLQRLDISPKKYQTWSHELHLATVEI